MIYVINYSSLPSGLGQLWDAEGNVTHHVYCRSLGYALNDPNIEDIFIDDNVCETPEASQKLLDILDEFAVHGVIDPELAYELIDIAPDRRDKPIRYETWKANFKMQAGIK